VTTFSDLGLSAGILQAISTIGYEHPSAIQSKTIPLLLQGKDVIGQAQTGTGKTAAFALPILSQLDLKQQLPQVLVLAPTRELAIQVAEAFQTYAVGMKGFHVLPIYGGTDFRGQLAGLRRGCHVIVGTPGRVMDHMRRGTLDLSGIKTIVLDEADEMLRMGFIDDVEWVLEQAPEKRQVCLFSATMPAPIRKIASTHLKDPQHVTIEMKTVSADTIRQRYWPVRGINKLDALTRILEAEPFTGMIIFVRTKTATVELADKLSARGFAASALNGDMSQALRENTVDKLRKGKLDILIATDVAARGLDVDRISHVVNYDIPYDVETYIHRIGRTGRAGKEGDAILFVAPREQRMLGSIEKATRKKCELMELPSTDLINDRRVAKFTQQITDTLGDTELGLYQQLIENYETEHNVPAREIAAALARLLQGDQPLFLTKNTHHKDEPFSAERPSARRETGMFAGKDEERSRKRRERSEEGGGEHSEARPYPSKRAERSESAERGFESRRPERSESGERSTESRRPDRSDAVEAGMDRYRIEIGHQHEVKPGNIVGAIANEAGIESQYIGRIQINDDHSFVDLPQGMPKEVFQHLKRVWVLKHQLNMSLVGSGAGSDKPRVAMKSKDKPRFQDSDKAAPRSFDKGADRGAPKSGFKRDAKPKFKKKD
jgi:ATP-dependent RNA helicase DeaD